MKGMKIFDENKKRLHIDIELDEDLNSILTDLNTKSFFPDLHYIRQLADVLSKTDEQSFNIFLEKGTDGLSAIVSPNSAFRQCFADDLGVRFQKIDAYLESKKHMQNNCC